MPDPPIILRLSALILILLTGCQKPASDNTLTSPDSPAQSALRLSIAEGLDTAALESLRWEDVALTTQSVLQQRVTDQVLAATEATTAPPLLYLRGLLFLSEGRGDDAFTTWEAIDLAEFSPDALYAPWRVARDRGTSPNRYDTPLAAAVAANQASPLVRARFHGLRGDWQKTLDNYLLTDPATWTPFDLRIFGMLRLQAGFRRDTAVLLAGALNGGRIPPPILAETAMLAKDEPLPDEAAVIQRLQDDPEFANAAARAAAQMLSLREAFLQNRFQEIVDKLRDTEPLQASDEAVYLGFLSSAQMQDMDSTEKWGVELLRRNPDAATQQWINTIKEEAR